MSNKYLEFISNMFGSESMPKQEELMELMDQTMRFFREMKGKMESKDEKERKEALDELNEVKRVLEGKLKSIVEKTGLSPDQLMALSGQFLSPQAKKTTTDLSEKLSSEGLNIFSAK